MWFKYGLKAQKLQKQHALNQRSPAEGQGKGQKLQKQHALKGQKLLAQGIALGIMAISKAPCKGKSFVYCQVFESFCPFRACGQNLRKFSNFTPLRFLFLLPASQ